MGEYVASNLVEPMRLDKWIATHFQQASRTQWQVLIDRGEVTVNNTVAQSRTLVNNEDTIVVPNVPSRKQAVEIMFENQSYEKLEYLYEDESVLVINKPAGLITHPAHANTKDSVVHRILAHTKSVKHAVWDEKNPVSLMRPGIVHRLDKDTSGVMIIAKTSSALHFLAHQIQAHQMKKRYIALAYGWLEEQTTEVNTWLNRDKIDRRRMAVYADGEGRDARTIFHIKHLMTTIKGDHATLLDAEPITGRTHQIRIHAAHIHHPLLGDHVYGTQESQTLSQNIGLKRQFLHASDLTIMLPNKHQPSTFHAPLAVDLEDALHYFLPY